MGIRLLALSLLGIALAPGPRSPAPKRVSLPAERPAAPSVPPSPVRTSVDFQKHVRPILNAHCQPCHFAGGKMYGHLPFDRPETIRTLGEKMFTRIKDEREQAVLRAFLAQKP